MRDLDLRRLRYFTVLAQTLHFGRAAELLHISQPGLSAEIRRLETQLGLALFTRTPRTALTHEGETLLAEAEAVLTGADRFASASAALASGQAGVVTIGSTAAVLEQGLLGAIARLAEDAPELRVIVEELSSAESSTALREGRIDLACGNAPADGPDVTATRLTAAPFALVVPAQATAALRPVSTATGSSPAPESLSDCADLPFSAFRRSASPPAPRHGAGAVRRGGLHPDLHLPHPHVAVGPGRRVRRSLRVPHSGPGRARPCRGRYLRADRTGCRVRSACGVVDQHPRRRDLTPDRAGRARSGGRIPLIPRARRTDGSVAGPVDRAAAALRTGQQVIEAQHPLTRGGLLLDCLRRIRLAGLRGRLTGLRVVAHRRAIVLLLVALHIILCHAPSSPSASCRSARLYVSTSIAPGAATRSSNTMKGTPCTPSDLARSMSASTQASASSASSAIARRTPASAPPTATAAATRTSASKGSDSPAK